MICKVRDERFGIHGPKHTCQIAGTAGVVEEEAEGLTYPPPAGPLLMTITLWICLSKESGFGTVEYVTVEYVTVEYATVGYITGKDTEDHKGRVSCKLLALGVHRGGREEMRGAVIRKPETSGCVGVITGSGGGDSGTEWKWLSSRNRILSGGVSGGRRSGSQGRSNLTRVAGANGIHPRIHELGLPGLSRHRDAKAGNGPGWELRLIRYLFG